MFPNRTRTGWLTALLALAVLAFGVSPALASASCGLLADTQACTEMTTAPQTSDHSDHPKSEVMAEGDDAATSQDDAQVCTHQHCHMTSSPVVPSVTTERVCNVSGNGVAIGDNAGLADQPGYGLEHPPRR